MANKYTANKRVFRGVLLMYEKPELVQMIKDNKNGNLAYVDRRGFQQNEIEDVLRAHKWAELCADVVDRLEAKDDASLS